MFDIKHNVKSHHEDFVAHIRMLARPEPSASHNDQTGTVAYLYKGHIMLTLVASSLQRLCLLYKGCVIFTKAMPS